MMKKQTWMGITKGLLLGAALSVSLLITDNAYAADPSAAPSSAETAVTYQDEKVQVTLDEDGKDGPADAVGYYFFTTTAVKANKIPATNKWERTIGGSVDVSVYPSGKTLYFANSTSPAYADIVTVVVPPQPKFKTISYKAAADSKDMVALLGNPKVTVKGANGKNKDIALKAEDMTQVQYRKKDTTAFTAAVDNNGKNFLTSLALYQKSGASVEFRTISDEAEEAVKGEDGKYYFSNADFITTDADKKADYVAGAFLRPGVIKTVKVTKLKAAPAVAIDFGNHAFTVKKGQEYAKADSSFMITGDWTKAEANKVIYFKDNEVYMVRTSATTKAAASLATFITTGTTKTFADSYGTDTKVTVQGGNADTTHVMTISRSVTAGKDAKETKKLNPAQAYEYAIVDSAEAYINTDGTLKYEEMASDVKAKKIAWKKASIAAGKSSVNVNLGTTKAPVIGKQVILRAAKGTNVLSSQYVILTAPVAKTESAEGVDYWTQKAQGASDAAACLNINGVPTYDAAVKQLFITAKSAQAVSEDTIVKIGVTYKVGKKTNTVQIDSAVAVQEGVATIKTPIESLGLNADSTSLTVTIPAGTLTGLDGAANAEKKLTVKVDTKSPVASYTKSASVKAEGGTVSGTVTLNLDSAVVLPGGEGKDPITLNTAAAELTKEQCAVFAEVYKAGTGSEGADEKVTVDVTGKFTYAKKKRTLTLTFNMDATSKADYKVVLSGITDAAGNAVAAKEGDAAATAADGKITFQFANPSYVAAETVAFKQQVYEVAKGESIDLNSEIVITPDNATNTAATWDIKGDKVSAVEADDRIYPDSSVSGKFVVGANTITGATATVTVTVDGKTATCTITAVEKAAGPEPAPSAAPSAAPTA